MRNVTIMWVHEESEERKPVLELLNKSERRLKDCHFQRQVPEPLCCPIAFTIFAVPGSLKYSH